jgi:hypothetical protein
MKSNGKMSLEKIRHGRLPGVGTGPDGSVVPIYTTEATGPDVTEYLVSALEQPVSLLRRVRVSAEPPMQTEIDDFIGRV